MLHRIPCRNLSASSLPGMKKPKRPTGGSSSTSRLDSFCYHWLGIPAAHAGRIVAMGLLAGAVMETFMIKVWVGQTNCEAVCSRISPA